MRIISATLCARISVLLLLQCARRTHAATTQAFVGCDREHGPAISATGGKLLAATGSARAVPGAPALVVIGAQKAGTTILAIVLTKLPGWCQSEGGEAHFFSRWKFASEPVNKTSLASYLALWDYCSSQAARQAGDAIYHTTSQAQEAAVVRFEKTPVLLATQHASLRICQSLPGVRLVVLLRNPIKRSYSGFGQGTELRRSVGSPRIEQVRRYADAFNLVAHVEMGVSRGCADALLLEPAAVSYAQRLLTYTRCCSAVVTRVAATNESLLPRAGTLRRVAGRWGGCTCMHGKHCTPFGSLLFMPVRRSIYATQLRPWFARFRAGDMYVVFNEELESNPVATLRAITAHAVGALGSSGGGTVRPPAPTMIASAWNATVAQHNKLNRSRTHGTMHAHTAAALRCFFAPHNCELAQLLGRPLPRSWGAGADVAAACAPLPGCQPMF